jgi:hypothetical protein
MGQPEDQHEWDEFEWERFLQERDRETDRFMELLEKYMDFPDCDRIIAREMGWTQAEVDPSEDDEEEIELENGVPVNEGPDEESEEEEEFQRHPLHRAAFSLTMWVLDYFEKHPEFQDHPAAVDLASNCATVSAKLAAALGGDEEREIGLTIAYLKRALKAANDALRNASVLSDGAKMGRRSARTVTSRLFEVRGGVVELIGDCRAEWRKRRED